MNKIARSEHNLRNLRWLIRIGSWDQKVYNHLFKNGYFPILAYGDQRFLDSVDDLLEFWIYKMRFFKPLADPAKPGTALQTPLSIN